jgi:hypothetical protein
MCKGKKVQSINPAGFTINNSPFSTHHLLNTKYYIVMYYTKFNVEYQENSKKISVTPHWIEVRIVDSTESMRILINRC